MIEKTSHELRHLRQQEFESATATVRQGKFEYQRRPCSKAVQLTKDPGFTQQQYAKVYKREVFKSNINCVLVKIRYPQILKAAKTCGMGEHLRGVS